MAEAKRKRVFQFKGGRKGRSGQDKLKFPLEVKAQLKKRYDDNDGTDATDLFVEILPMYNEWRVKKKKKPVAVPREPAFLFDEDLDDEGNTIQVPRIDPETGEQAFEYDPEGEPMEPLDTNDPEDDRDYGGIVPEGHIPMPKSYYDTSAPSRIWGIQDGFMKICDNPKHKLHKQATALAEQLGLGDWVDADAVTEQPVGADGETIDDTED